MLLTGFSRVANFSKTHIYGPIQISSNNTIFLSHLKCKYCKKIYFCLFIIYLVKFKIIKNCSSIRVELKIYYVRRSVSYFAEIETPIFIGCNNMTSMTQSAIFTLKTGDCLNQNFFGLISAQIHPCRSVNIITYT